MPDNIATLTFTNSPLNTLGALPLTTYSGTLTVDYTTGAVTGNLTVAPAAGVQTTTYSTFTLTPNGGNAYTINGTGATVGLAPSTISLQYTGQQPTAVTTQYSVAGVEVADNTNAPLCFAAGTMIRTARGEVAIENLSVGDLVVTSSGALSPVRWLGHRVVDCRNHPRPYEVMPVRVSAHAFGPDRPARDLVVSAGHALCVDVVGEVLIMALSLVNGNTVRQEDVDSIAYWHVELDRHDIIFAENMPAESYIDMGNRSFFSESEVVAFEASPDAAERTHADFCRPFHANGIFVDVVRTQLAARAEQLGWHLEDQGLGDLHLEVDGRRIDPQVRGLMVRFAVPADARNVWLSSTTSIPAEVGNWPDTRRLGVCFAALEVDDGYGTCRRIAVDDPRLCVGFQKVEHDDTMAWRWTAGRARLPASLWEGMEGELFLRLYLTRPALPRWAAPAAVACDQSFALAG